MLIPEDLQVGDLIKGNVPGKGQLITHSGFTFKIIEDKRSNILMPRYGELEVMMVECTYPDYSHLIGNKYYYIVHDHLDKFDHVTKRLRITPFGKMINKIYIREKEKIHVNIKKSKSRGLDNG